MKQYLELVQHVLDNGTRKPNRTGVDTISTFNYNYEIDLQYGFPLLTTKTVSWKNIVIEMLWFLSGSNNNEFLEKHNCKFWRPWYDENNPKKVKASYGPAWRKFPTHGTISSSDMQTDGNPCCDYNDQIKWVLDEMKRNPMSRRLVVSAWAPDIAQSKNILPPCHCMFMFNVQNGSNSTFVHYGHNEGQIPVCGRYDNIPILPNGKNMGSGLKWCEDCQRILQDIRGTNEFKNPEPNKIPRLCLHLTQRSCDVALGVPYNIASYALLLHLFSRFTGIEPGIFAHTLVDAHIYTGKEDGSMAEYDHIPGLKEQLTRGVRTLPKLVINPSIKDLKDVEELMSPKLTTDEIMKHFILEGYEPHPAIGFKVAV